VVIDFLDPRLLTVKEAEKIVGIPSAGWQILKQDLPTELFAERQARQFVATLMRNRARDGTNVFAFTAIKTKGGVTNTILDAAKTIRELGSSVIVVEANTFTPGAQFRQATAGLTDLLSDGLPFEPLICCTEYANIELEFIGVGTQASKGLTRLDRLKALLDALSKQYDYVLIDLPPLMVSPDAEMVIGVVGQVFLVVQAETVKKSEVRKAAELLRKIDPEAVGLFVNHISLERSPSHLEQNIVETLTRTQYAQFSAGQQWRLQLDLWLTMLRERLRGFWSRNK
jgi:Mrp family chromosome partitioning ATPase